MDLLYILDENDNPVAVEITEEGVLKWSAFFQDYNRRSIKTSETDEYKIYTNFLGSNSNMGKLGRPLLWGTAVKRKKDNKFILEYEFDTKEEALECHDKLYEAAINNHPLIISEDVICNLELQSIK